VFVELYVREPLLLPDPGVLVEALVAHRGDEFVEPVRFGPRVGLVAGDERREAAEDRVDRLARGELFDESVDELLERPIFGFQRFRPGFPFPGLRHETRFITLLV